MIIAPRTPTSLRWTKLRRTDLSILRSLQYEAIEGLTLRGRTLDVGGGVHNSYWNLLRIEGVVESINISASVTPSIVADLNDAMPIRSDVYDNVISLNTFEHVQDDVTAVAEAYRVLKPGGWFHILLPFLYRVHASPFDFHRHTGLWWDQLFLHLGADPSRLLVEPLVWDPVSSGFSFFEFTRLRGVAKPLCMGVGPLREWRHRRTPRLPEERGRFYSEYALGYYIRGCKHS